MANRRTYGYDQSMLTQPASSMTPRGSQPDAEENAMSWYMEHPDTMRRRITPMVGEPQQSSTMLQDLLAMLNGGQ